VDVWRREGSTHAYFMSKGVRDRVRVRVRVRIKG